MGWETLANIGLGASTTPILSSLNPSTSLKVPRQSFVLLILLYFRSSFHARVYFFFPLSSFFPFPRTLNFFLIRFLFYFVLLLTILFSLTASFTCLFCTRGLFLLSCTTFLFPPDFSSLHLFIPSCFFFFIFFFTLFFKGCSCSLSENLFVWTGLASSLFTLFLFKEN